MGSYLADTNLLLRLADPDSEQHPVATQALARLLGQGDEVYITPQNFIDGPTFARRRNVDLVGKRLWPRAPTINARERHRVHPPPPPAGCRTRGALTVSHVRDADYWVKVSCES